MMQLLQKKKENYIPAIVISLILTILVVIFFDLPQYSQHTEKVRALQQAEDETTNTENAQKQVASLLDKISTEKDQLSKLDLAIPSDPTIPDLYAHLETLAKSSNLVIDTIQATDTSAAEEQQSVAAPGSAVMGLSPDAAQTAGQPAIAKNSSGSATLGTMVVNLGLKGDVSGFNQFLSSVARSLRIMDIQSIDVSKGEENSTSGASSSSGSQMSFRLVIKTYYQK